MTLRERAKACAVAVVAKLSDGWGDGEERRAVAEALPAIEAALFAAVAEERKACAECAAEADRTGAIASAAIRARVTR